MAYRRLVEPLRAELHAHCYRMLGSVHDAEDALQDALLKAWRGLRGFQGRSSPRAWLYRIATNACLDAIARRPKRVLPPDHGPAAAAGEGPGAPLVESVWLEPYPDEVIGVEDGLAAPEARYERRESVELAFIAALQHLPARQRAALILRDVLGFSARETAGLARHHASRRPTAPCSGRARRSRSACRTRASRRRCGRSARRGCAELVEGYVEAWERGDVEAIVAMLTEDAVVAMPPMPTWYAGREAIAGLPARLRVRRALDRRALRGRPSGGCGWCGAGRAARWRSAPTAGTRGGGAYLPYALQVLTLRGDRIADVTGFVTPAALPAVGLPAELAR